MVFNAEISYLLLLRNYMMGRVWLNFYLFILHAGFKREVLRHFLGKIAKIQENLTI